MHMQFKIARLEAGLTQQALARLAGLSETTVSRVETGRTTDPGIRRRLAAALGRAVADLFPDQAAKHGDAGDRP